MEKTLKTFVQITSKKSASGDRRLRRGWLARKVERGRGEGTREGREMWENMEYDRDCREGGKKVV
jgi:hypothetical protein